MFKALGWDIENEYGDAEAYKDVVHEDAIKVGGATKAPDYCFRIGGTRKFFLEAKKPSVNVKDDIAAAFQLRRYAWSAKLPLSILTDFEEFAVYDCRVKPEKFDKSSTARILYVTFDQYLDRWEEIAGVFSKEAIRKGSFDRFAESTKGKKGTAEVDAAFLKEIEEWRSLLARMIALRNPSLTQRELNYAVQVTIDRIIFLRICEDRGIEGYGELQSLCNGANTYARLLDLYRKADQRYNSGLFHFERERGRSELPDTLTLGLIFDDKALKDILRRMYYPDSPYEFSVLPADILGQVYEQFLGKVIRLTAGHRAVVEDKPEVKKAGGVYYTPTDIVEYIVKNTVGKLLEGSNPRKVSKLRVLDPACGSGSFLIGAFQCLVDWHRKWYVSDGPQKHTKELFVGPGGEWRLSTGEKKRILLNNLYGVDIDSQAVETTKLSLLLKVLEGETQETINAQLSFLHERALPDLASNIKCGNSLIEPGDDPEQMTLLEPEELLRLNVFDWRCEFGEIMASGGFDAIIGNPPYLKIEHVGEADRVLFAKIYRTLMRRFDVFGLFIEKSIQLLADGGYFGMILPSTMLNNLTFSALRRLLLERTSIRSIVNLGGHVFDAVNNDTLILLFSNGPDDGTETTIYDVCKYGKGLGSAALVGTRRLVDKAKAPGYEFELRMSDEIDELFGKMRQHGVRLGDVCGCFQGFVTGSNEAYIVDEAAIRRESLETGDCKPALFGDNISRYQPPRSESYVIYLTREADLSKLPNIARRLDPFKAKLSMKREVRNGRQPWFSLHWPRVQANFEQPNKVLVQAIRNLALPRRIVATLDQTGAYADHTLNVIYAKAADCNLLFVLGVLNSALLNFVFGKKHIDINIKGVYLMDLPLPRLDFNDGCQAAKHDKLVSSVQAMLDANSLLVRARTEQERAVYERQTANLDRDIDQLVYELYGLADEDIRLVQDAQKTR